MLALQNDDFSARAAAALNDFIQLMTSLNDEIKDRDLDVQVDLVLRKTGLLAFYQKDRTETGMSRVENLEELIAATSQYKPDESVEHVNLMTAFLSHVALETGEGQEEQNSNCVSLMTLHASKGLEFPVVFMVGMEENLFPHKMSVEERNGLEEERRLCYVGMTRAMKKLYITYADSRRLYGMEQFNRPSRFIAEIPPDLLHAVRPTTKVTYSAPSSSNQTWQRVSDTDTGFKIGQRVVHAKFGEGVIINFEGNGEHARVQVKFKDVGSKWLVASFAKLEAV